jgi:hypothetical protein
MSEKYVYVVTRNKRRTEDRDYSQPQDAELRAAKLKAILKEWDPADVKNVEVVRTKKPNRIR